MFLYLQRWLDWVFSLFGYYPAPPMDTAILIEAYQDRLFEIDGLVQGMGHLERKYADLNRVVTTLLVLQGKEEMDINNDALAEVYDQKLETVFLNKDNVAVTCKVQIMPEVDDANS